MGILGVKLHNLTTVRVISSQSIFFLFFPWNDISKYILMDVIFFFPLMEIAFWFVIRMHLHGRHALVLTLSLCVYLLFHFIQWQTSRYLLLTVDWNNRLYFHPFSFQLYSTCSGFLMFPFYLLLIQPYFLKASLGSSDRFI